MTASDLIDALQKLPPETLILVQDNLTYRQAALARIASTAYCLFPGQPKAAIVKKADDAQ